MGRMHKRSHSARLALPRPRNEKLGSMTGRHAIATVSGKARSKGCTSYRAATQGRSQIKCTHARRRAGRNSGTRCGCGDRCLNIGQPQQSKLGPRLALTTVGAAAGLAAAGLAPRRRLPSLPDEVANLHSAADAVKRLVLQSSSQKPRMQKAGSGVSEGRGAP